MNPSQAWPLLKQVDFSNLRPAFFKLPERGRLFKMRFGFASWDDAMASFNIAFPELQRRKHKSLLQSFFQFLAALWRMRTYTSVEELAAYFGVTRWKMVC